MWRIARRLANEAAEDCDADVPEVLAQQAEAAATSRSPANGRATERLRAWSEGNTQLVQYCQGLENWYAKDKAALLSTYPNVKQCERGGRLELRTELVTYSFCPSSVDELGERLEPIAPDVSIEGD